MDNSKANNRIARNTAFLYIRLAFILLVSLYTTRVVLNVLGVVDYGIYNVVAGFVSLFSFLNASMSISVQRFYSFKKGSDGQQGMIEVFNTSIIIQFVIMMVTLALLESFGLWYINYKMVIPEARLVAANWLFQFSVFNLAIVIMQIPFAGAIIASEKMDYYAMVGVIDVLMKLGVVLALPYVSLDKLVFYGSLILVTGILNFLLYAFYAYRKLDYIKFHLVFKKPLFKQMLSFTGWNILDYVAYMVKGQGINVLLNAFCGPVVNAARGVAYQVSNAISGFQSNIVMAFRPQLIQSYAENQKERVLSLMYSASKLSFVLLGTFCIPIILEIDYILQLWLKGVVPDYTVPFTIIILINMLISSLNTPLSQVTQAVGKLRNYQIYRNVITLCVIPVSWFALNSGASPVAVFIISFIITIIVHPVSMALLHQIFPYSYKNYCLKVLLPCLAFLLFAPVVPYVVKCLLTESVGRFLAVSLISVITSAVTAMMIVFDKAERNMVLGWISKIIKRSKRK